MTYLDDIGDQIRSRVSSNLVPDENTKFLFRIYAVLLLAKGEDVDAADVHNAWVAWMGLRDPSHDALIPFSDLEQNTADFDLPYVRAIHEVARSEAQLGR